MQAKGTRLITSCGQSTQSTQCFSKVYPCKPSFSLLSESCHSGNPAWAGSRELFFSSGFLIYLHVFFFLMSVMHYYSKESTKFLCVSTCTYIVCAHMCACVQRLEVDVRCLLSHSPPYSLRGSLLLNLELGDSTRLTSWSSSLPLPLQCLDYRRVQMWLALWI